MGPRSIDRGKLYKTSLVFSESISLQWGRDQLIAESTGERFGTNGYYNMLQWGRDQLIAERASPPLTERQTEIGLQWGRDQLIAERARLANLEATANAASMGPRSIDRGK